MNGNGSASTELHNRIVARLRESDIPEGTRMWDFAYDQQYRYETDPVFRAQWDARMARVQRNISNSGQGVL